MRTDSKNTIIAKRAFKFLRSSIDCKFVFGWININVPNMTIFWSMSGGGGGGRVRGANLLPNFQKGGLDRTSIWEEGCNFQIKNKLKSGIFNDKKCS